MLPKINYTARTVRAVFFAAVAVLLSISVTLYWGIQNLVESYYWVNHTWEVEYKVLRAYSGLKNAESGVRAYLLTGDTSYLEEKTEVEAAMPQWIANLNYLVQDNGKQQRNMAHFEQLIRKRLLILDTSIILYKAGRLPATQVPQRLAIGRQMMQQMQVLATQMFNEEAHLLQKRERTKDRYAKVVPVYLVLLTAVVLLLIIIIFNHLQRQLKTLQRTQTQLQEFNLRLEQQKRALEITNEELESFNYVASHDLKEPLRKISTFTSMIQMEGLDGLSEKAKHHFFRIQTSVQRMQLLLDDLLAYTRLKSGNEAFAEVALTAVVEKVKENLQETIAETGAAIEVHDLPVVTGIPFQLYQLMDNLLSNAIKYRKKNTPPVIHIRGSIVKGSTIPQAIKLLQNTPNYYCIAVADNGIGFSQEYAPKAFELFSRLHNDPAQPGTGIGLTICKKVVENHQGFIRVESTPGKGTTFFIYLPENGPTEAQAF